MVKLIDEVAQSKTDVINKAVYLAQELWLHQPFVGGNKRTDRLMINFLTMKEGFPLFVFNAENLNYNALLVQQYIENKPGLVYKYVHDNLYDKMKASLDKKIKKGKDRGYRMLL
ncbi:MAG: Fic family protein [Flavobacteriaceae bacterium]